MAEDKKSFVLNKEWIGVIQEINKVQCHRETHKITRNGQT
jgi:hypothetical protein